jgi:hypothetical protein
MQYRSTLFLTLCVCAALVLAACTAPRDTTAGSSPVTVPVSGVLPAQGASLVTSPTDALPEYNRVTVDIGEKDYLGYIPVIFQGGPGQIHVKKIEVILYRSDGMVKTATIGTNKGAIVELEGTRQDDRVVVYVSMDNGGRYTISDVIRSYRTR